MATRQSLMLATMLPLLLQTAAAFPAEFQAASGGNVGLLVDACPDADLDTWHDCSVAACDPAGLTCGDCDDSNGAIHPGAADGCNHVDDDCDGAVDEGYPWLPAAEKVLDPGRASGHEHGTSIAVVGDVNGDSVPDFVAGSPKTGAGRVVLYSGADRSVVCRTTDGASGEQIGTTVAGIGDVTGDGVPDFAAGVPRAAGGKGAIAVYSGAPATPGAPCPLVRRCLDPEGVAGDYLGGDYLARAQGLAGWTDVTGDGVPEILAGAPESDRIATNAGLVIVFNPAVAPDCAVVRRASDPSAQAGSLLGWSVAGLGDVTGDGVADFAAGAYSYDDTYGDAGGVFVFSGNTADAAFVRLILDPLRRSDQLGYSLDPIEDRDGDGRTDLVAGAPVRDTAAGADAGQVLILSTQGVADPVLARLDEGVDGASAEYLGRAVAVVEDADGDGAPDVLAGAHSAYSSRGTRDGHAVLFSGGSGSPIAVFEDPEGAYADNLGWSVEGIGDLSGDGAGDFLAGAPLDDVPKTGNSAGSVLLFALESDCDGDSIGPFGGDCDDDDADRYPGNPETCDGLDNDCDGAADEDGDGDGQTICEEEGGGCDPGDSPDENPAIYPGAPETCNGIDDDCNGFADDGPDADSDSYSIPCDCDDGDVTRHPGVAEVCNHSDDNCGAVDEGFAAVVTPKKTFDTAHAGAFFGRSVAAIGDVTGDTVPDLAVGYPGDATAGSWRGSVVVLSGADRATWCKGLNNAAGVSEQLGSRVVATGDLNHDGWPDFAAAATYSDVTAYDAGEIILFSGRTCAVLAHCTDPEGAAQDYLGYENGLAAGDVDDDGFVEIIAGTIYADPGGKTEAGKLVVFRYDGACTRVRSLTDPLGVNYDRLGISVAVVGDVSGDGHPDIAAGEYNDDWAATDAGSVLVFSGADGAFVRRMTDPAPATSDWLGWSVAGAADLNGDGWPEILAGSRLRNTAQGGDAGEVEVFSGRDGTLLRRLSDPAGAASELLGWSVATVPDVDGDGIHEIAAGAPYADAPGANDAGRVVLFSGATGAKLGSLANPEPKQADYMGFSVTGIGDLNGDGSAEVVAGVSNDEQPKYANDEGSIVVFFTESDCDGDARGPTGLDCDDGDADVYGGNAEVCDAKDNDCDLLTDEDEDGDGYDACAESACDPARDPNRSPSMHPGATELCNGIDDDCDGETDEGADADGDGYETPCDCDDDPVSGAAVHPGATELCNHVADGCGAVDDGFARLTNSASIVDAYPVAGDHFAGAMTSVGDLDGDGVPDLAVGAPNDDTACWECGQVTLLSGKDRHVLCRTALAGGVGVAVAGLHGDLDGDFVPDFAASAPGADAILLLSGADCSEIARCEDPYLEGNGLGSEHGLAVWEDVTGDGIREILAGGPGSNVWNSHAGVAFAFRYSAESGTCGVLLELHDPDAAGGDYLGWALAGIDDVTGDAFPDIAVAEPGDSSRVEANGAVLVFSGADGSFFRRMVDPNAGTRDHLGYGIGAMRDMNDDGWPEVAAGVEFGDAVAADAGHVVIFSGKDGSVLRRFGDPSGLSGDRLGSSLAVVDDVDGDGVDEIWAGAPFADVGGVVDTGRAVLLSGATGARLANFDNPAPTAYDYFGVMVASAGDLSGDGVPELLAGTPVEDAGGVSESGSAMLYGMDTECDGDGLTPFTGDCDDANADLWRVPLEARNLLFTNKTQLGWEPPAADPGQGLEPFLYDVLRTDSPFGFDVAVCVESDESDLVASDTDEPGSGASYFYLVRAQNSCGEGDLGLALGEWPRIGPICP